VVEYPIGHKRRREEGLPELIKKFKLNLARRFPERQQQRILSAACAAVDLVSYQDERWGVAHFGARSSGWFFVWIEIVPEYGAAVVAASKRPGLPRLRKNSLIGY
jgi:hypothetical protein